MGDFNAERLKTWVPLSRLGTVDRPQALATTLVSGWETAELEDAELYLESHTRLADLVTDASWLLFQLLQQ